MSCVRLRRVPLLVLLSLALSWSGPVAGQSPPPLEPVELTRPIPGPVVPPSFYREALAAETRSDSGAPGPEYWQSRSSYEIEARLDPLTATVSGSERVVFHNRSPQEIPYLMLHLHQNLYSPGVTRNEPEEITGGLALQRVAAAGTELFASASDEEPGYAVTGSLMRLQPPEPVPPGGDLELEVSWSFVVPVSGSGRMGHSGTDVFFIGYWFPKIAVYDDLRGWDAEPYLGIGEFYDSYDDYDVTISVPVDWTVDATGTLQNPEQVYSRQTRDRLASVAAADAPVRIADPEDREQHRVTTQPAEGALTYRFTAPHIRDFAWTASATQVWDATVARVADRDGDGADDSVLIHSFWRPGRAPLWKDQARYAADAIESHSRTTRLAYPWPHMTSVEGDDMISGGMEFPMMTLIGPYRDRGGTSSLYSVTAHELAHMWTPMIVGSNEKRYAWMDEGFADYLGNVATGAYFPDEEDPELTDRELYLGAARAEREGSMMLHGDYYAVGYGTASYEKPATLLVTLRNLLGEEVFAQAIHTYMSEWAFKHPTPWDFFSTLERFAGSDLDWFWSSWYYETWTLDRAVGEVESGPEGSTIVIEDHGFVPMPAPVLIRTREGGDLERMIPVSYWLTGATSYEIELPASAGEVLEVQIDPEGLFPDLNPDDDVWPARKEDGDG